MPRYSETVVEHCQSPRNYGRLEAPDAVGLVGVPGRGPFFVLQLTLRQEHVQQARFQCSGCGATIAAGSVLTELIAGKSVADCRRITPGDLLASLGGLPPEKLHCASIAVKALESALDIPETTRER